MIFRRTIQQGNFDSVLHPASAAEPARLVVRLKVRLVPRDPTLKGDPTGGKIREHLAGSEREVKCAMLADRSGMPWKARSWIVYELNAFKIKFKKMAELGWNDQLILLPPDGTEAGETMSDHQYADFIGKPEVPAHIRCALDIQLVDAGGSPHATIEVVKLREDEGQKFPSYQLQLTNEDVGFKRRYDHRWDTTFLQNTAAHEIGHWLGEDQPVTDPKRFLPHIESAACARDPLHERNDDCEYGRKPGKRMALMGVGSLVTNFEARPWWLRARMHTNAKAGWDIVHRIHFDQGRIPVSERQKGLFAAATKAAAQQRIPI